MLIDAQLPEQMRGKARTLDAKGLSALFKELHETSPDSYPTVLKNLADIGRRVSTETGGFSFGPEDLIEPDHITALKNVIRQKVHHEIIHNRPEAALSILRGFAGTLPKDLYAHQLSIGSPMAKQIASGSRGNPGAMARLMSGDVLYVDHRDREVPYPILRGFAEGLDPAEYFGASFGGRKGVVDTKLSVQNSGALAKVLKQAVHKFVVTKQEDDFQDHPDRPRGLPVDTEDAESDGAFLAHGVAGFPRNTILNSKVRAAIKAKGVDRILVRSPISGRIAPGGGLYAKDVGIRESGSLPGIGDNVGVTASDTISEPVGQGTLCLAIGTLVRMADWTVKAIELIEPGEWVMGADKDNNLFPVQVLNRFNNGLKLCHRTDFNVGCTKEVISLESTLDHKVSGTARYWDPKTELVVPGIFPIGHKCVKFSAAMANSVTNSAGREEPFALLFGLLLGDGCYTESVHSVNLSCHDPLLIADINPKLEGLNLQANKLKGHKGYYKIAMIEDETRATDPTTGQFIPIGAVNPIKKELIRRSMYGKYAHEKIIPEDVWEWDNKSVSDLIGGFFATDGSVYGTSVDGDFFKNVYVSFGSTSLTMLDTLRRLLAVRYGIYATVPNRQSKGRKRPFWTMSVNRRNEVIKFYESIPLYGIKKKTFETLLSKWKPLQIKNYSFFYRKKQESLGLLETFDIEVDHPDHLFQLANGLIVSNSAKHAGGAAGSVRKVGGFKALQQTISVPKTFPGGAAHADTDGNVDSITDHPDGGKVVSISGTEHYVAPGFKINVKPGDSVEAGDPISDGLPNPSKIADHQGLGEAKRKMVGYLKSTLDDLNIASERRNLELVAHGLVNHVMVDDELGPYYPGDVVPYDEIEKHWEPRPDSRLADVDDAAGQYLEHPVLHYSVGTKIRPSVRKELKSFGIKNIHVHPEAPPFHAHMVRAQDSLRHDPDWMTRFLGTNLEDSLLDSTHRGLSSSPSSVSFVPAVASGQIENYGPITGKGILKSKPGSVLSGVGMFGKAADAPREPSMFSGIGAAPSVNQPTPVAPAPAAPPVVRMKPKIDPVAPSRVSVLAGLGKHGEEDSKHGQHYCSVCGTMVWQCRCMRKPGQETKQYHDVDPSECRNCNPGKTKFDKLAAGFTAAAGTGGTVTGGPMSVKTTAGVTPMAPKPKVLPTVPKPPPQPKAVGGVSEGNSLNKQLPGVESNPLIDKTPETNHSVSPLTSAAVAALGQPVAQHGGLAGLAALTDFTGHSGSNLQTLLGDSRPNPNAYLYDRALPAGLNHPPEPTLPPPVPAAPAPPAVAAPAPAAPPPPAAAAPAPATPAAPAAPAAPAPPPPPAQAGVSGMVGGTVAGNLPAVTRAAGNLAVKNAPKVIPQGLARGAGGAGAMAVLPVVGDTIQQLAETGKVDTGRLGGVAGGALTDAATFAGTNAALNKAVPGGPGFVPTQIATSTIKDIADSAGILPEWAGGSKDKATRIQNAQNTQEAVGEGMFGKAFRGEAYTPWDVAKAWGQGALNSLSPKFITNTQAAIKAHNDYEQGNKDRINANMQTGPMIGASARSGIAKAQAKGDPALEMRNRLSAAESDARLSHSNMMSSAPLWSTGGPKGHLWSHLGDQMADLARARVMHEHGMKEDGTPMATDERYRLGEAIKQRSTMVQRNQDTLNKGFWSDAFSG